jgi:hypothetical protein
MVGNLYLPTSYKPGDKLPAVVVAGAWTTVMWWPEWLQFNAIAAAPKVNIPTLFIHSDNSALPEITGNLRW